MSRFEETMLRAFEDEVSKEASFPSSLYSVVSPNKLRALGGGVGTGMGLGALGGLVAGGVSGAKKNYEAAQESGAGGARSALAGTLGGLAGAAGGAAKGALVGSALGGAAALARPTQVSTAARSLGRQDGVLGSFSRFGQRQVHGLTGWTPTAGKHGLKDLRLTASEGAKEMGLTSLPGMAKAIQREGLGAVAKQGLKDQMDGGSRRMQALGIALPMAQVGHGLLSKERADGPGKGELVGKGLGFASGLLAPTSLPITTGAILGAGLDKGFGAAGRAVDRLRGRKAPEPQRLLAAEPGDTGQAAMEHVHGSGYTGDIGA